MNIKHDEAELGRLAAFYDARVAHFEAESPGYERLWRDLSAQILEHGGMIVCAYPEPDPDLLPTVVRGEYLPAENIRRMEGEPRECHQNTAKLWVTGIAKTVMTGYALSSDGIWRPHSWGLDENETIVETTVHWIGYYGFRMDDFEACRFAFSNIEPDIMLTLMEDGDRAPVIIDIARELLQETA